LAILNRAPNNKTLRMLQGFATGLMLSMSFFDLAYDAVNAIGFLKGNLWVRIERPSVDICKLFFKILTCEL